MANAVATKLLTYPRPCTNWSSAVITANREINRDFLRFRAQFCDSSVQSSSNFNVLQPNSLRNGTGNYFHETGNYLRRTGNFLGRSRERSSRAAAEQAAETAVIATGWRSHWWLFATDSKPMR